MFFCTQCDRMDGSMHIDHFQVFMATSAFPPKLCNEKRVQFLFLRSPEARREWSFRQSWFNKVLSVQLALYRLVSYENRPEQEYHVNLYFTALFLTRGLLYYDINTSTTYKLPNYSKISATNINLSFSFCQKQTIFISTFWSSIINQRKTCLPHLLQTWNKICS